MPQLTHYTASPNAISGILSHGFAWVPNRRNLAIQLIPERDFSHREPQQFGMISFTELGPNETSEHSKQFGPLGITVTAEWASKHHAQRVVYVPASGPFSETLRSIFSIGYEDLQARIRYPDDGVWQMAFENKVVASTVAGASLWANLLGIWEYLEPECSAHQREWRIVNDSPDYSIFGATKNIIADVSPPENWAKFTRVIPIRCEDIVQFVCPTNMLSVFQSEIPASFETVPIFETS